MQGSGGVPRTEAPVALTTYFVEVERSCTASLCTRFCMIARHEVCANVRRFEVVDHC